MTTGRLEVEGLSGFVSLIEAPSPAEARVLARSVEIPENWFFSRSYRDHFGLVAACAMRIGVDLEVIDLSVTADAVLTSDEQRLDGGPIEWCSWWSAKEALAKALGDARRYDPRRLGSPALWQLGRQGLWRAESLEVPMGYLGWVVWECDLAS